MQSTIPDHCGLQSRLLCLVFVSLILLLETSGKGNRAVLDTQGALSDSIPLVYRSHSSALVTVVPECFLLAQQLN